MPPHHPQPLLAPSPLILRAGRTGRASLLPARAHDATPPARGLYDPAADKDACGVGFVGELNGAPTRACVSDALEMLVRMAHRGACGCEANTGVSEREKEKEGEGEREGVRSYPPPPFPFSSLGDGAGILVAIPHAFFATVAKRDVGIELPPAGQYGVGSFFLPTDADERGAAKAAVAAVAAECGHTLLGWRPVPTDGSMLGASARATQPNVQHAFFAPSKTPLTSSPDPDAQWYVLRKLIEAAWTAGGVGADDAYACSLSSQTVVYKGQLTPAQVPLFYPDLADPAFSSHVALVHSRFSTNTFPSWGRAQPMRTVGHNGEINTLRGNANWMRARQGVLRAKHLGVATDVLRRMLPIIPFGQSDSGSFDAVLELLVRSGRSLPEAMMLLIPEAWQNDALMPAAKRDMYRYGSALMEPWDGPALVAFTDGRSIGATLDRNGLRPGRYTVTKDGRVVMASETGVVDIDPANVASKGRLMPGNLFLVDFTAGRVVRDEEIKAAAAAAHPYGAWLEEHTKTLADVVAAVGENAVVGAPALAPASDSSRHDPLSPLVPALKAAGYTRESVDLLLLPMAKASAEPLGSMGNDTPLAALSRRPKLLPDYFKQLFAQVTNPPLDPLREKVVTSTKVGEGGGRGGGWVGARATPFQHASPPSLPPIF